MQRGHPRSEDVAAFNIKHISSKSHYFHKHKLILLL